MLYHLSYVGPCFENPRGMERETGFEPATPSLEGSCSSQLSYSRSRAAEHLCRQSGFPPMIPGDATRPPNHLDTAFGRRARLEGPERTCESSFKFEPTVCRAPATVVERGGFEPPKAKPADLQSAPVDRFGTSPFLRHD